MNVKETVKNAGIWQWRSEIMAELKPCPLCNGETELRYVGIGEDIEPYIHCCDCYVDLFFKNAYCINNLIDSYNRRTNDD